MHELSVTESIIRICSQEAIKNKADKVLKIKLLVGELTGMIPESIQYYFDIAGRETKVQGAKLEIIKVPVKIYCSSCSCSSVLKKGDFTCPVCKSTDIKIIGGNEFLIESIEVE